jgi:hypothetical protein
MRFARHALLPGMAVLLLLGLHARAAPATSPSLYYMRYEIYGIGGLHLLTNRTTVETSATRYAIAMNLKTRGLAGFFVDLQSHSVVRGRLLGDMARPEEYSGEVRRNGADRQTRIAYGADGMVASDWNSPSIEPAAFIPANRTHGTVDQLTAYFILERELADRHTCDSAIPVFDGVHRYNLYFTDAPAKALPRDLQRHFTGPVRVCRMSRKDFGSLTDHEGAYSGKIWYARLDEGGRMMVPVQMEFDTELGTVKGYLAELRGRGIDLHLTQ